MNFFKKLIGKKDEKPTTLKAMLDAGLISKEEFLHFTITQKTISLEKSKQDLKDFLDKGKKKKK